MAMTETYGQICPACTLDNAWSAVEALTELYTQDKLLQQCLSILTGITEAGTVPCTCDEE